MLTIFYLIWAMTPFHPNNVCHSISLNYGYFIFILSDKVNKSISRIFFKQKNYVYFQFYFVFFSYFQKNLIVEFL